jgi:hypothetical protein
MQDPFKSKSDVVPTEDKAPTSPNKTKQRKMESSVEEVGAARIQKPVIPVKLDLNNIKWWNTGFDNTYIEQQLQNFLKQSGVPSNVSDMAKAALIEGTLLEESFANI